MVLTIVTDSIFTVLANVSNKNKKTSAPVNNKIHSDGLRLLKCLNSTIFRCKSMEACIL